MQPALSIWEKESFFAHQDVLIIGSGFAGLWSAYFLQQSMPNAKITILESGLIPTGASTRNAGFSCFGSPTELLADGAQMGEAKMWELVEMRYRGLKIIQELFGNTAIDFDPVGGYECFNDKSIDWQQTIERLDSLNEGLKNITGCDNVFRLADEEIPQLGLSGFSHLIKNELEAGIHSGKLASLLMQKVAGMGVQMLTGMEVLETNEDDRQVLVKAKNGTNLYEFSANQLLYCTNAFSRKWIPGYDIFPNRGQIILTSAIPNLSLKGTFHFDEGYYYFRNLGNRVLLGGARNADFEVESTTELSITDKIQQALETFLEQHILNGKEYAITDRWSGIMAMGKDKSPIVESLTRRSFCCVRMNGMGVALAPYLGQKMAGMMKERY